MVALKLCTVYVTRESFRPFAFGLDRIMSHGPVLSDVAAGKVDGQCGKG